MSLRLLLAAAAAAIATWQLRVPGLQENSGLTASRTQPGVFWTHNDSGHAPDIFAVTADGRLLQRFQIEGARNVDWEAITSDEGGHLWIGDLGDNNNDRTDPRLIRVVEPTLSRDGAPGKVPLDGSLGIRYADRPLKPGRGQQNWDAEALFWADGSPWILTKHRSDTLTTLYRVPRDAAAAADGRQLVLVPSGSFDVGGADKPYGGMVSSAETTADGRRLAVLTYHAIFVFSGDPTLGDWLSHPPQRIELNQLQVQQCEAIVWDGPTLLVTNEGGSVFRFALP